jgi:hypothetical protein
MLPAHQSAPGPETGRLAALIGTQIIVVKRVCPENASERSFEQNR